MKKLIYAGTISFLLLLGACSKDVRPLENAKSEITSTDLILQFKPGTTQRDVDVSISLIGGTIKEHFTTVGKKRCEDGFYIVEVKDVTHSLNILKNIAAVLDASPDYQIENAAAENQQADWHATSPLSALSNALASYTNDPLVDQQWNVHGPNSVPAETFGSNAAPAWAAGHTGSSGVIVGLPQGGLDINHEDLSGNIWTNPGEIAGNGIDDDANGYIDDIHGWNFLGNNNQLLSAADNSKGTEVAGMIGAKGNNSIGIAGINWNVTLLPVKFREGWSFNVSDGIKALEYLLHLHTRANFPTKITAINLDWAVGNKVNAFESVIRRLNDNGVLIISPVPGYVADVDKKNFAYYPVKYTYANVIGVSDLLRNGSLYGAYGAVSVDLAANGQNILTTTLNNSYATVSWFPTAQVTAACALYKAKNPGANAAQIKNAILSNTIQTPFLPGKVATGGRLNVKGALGL